MQASLRDRRKRLALALAVSSGLHVSVMLALDTLEKGRHDAPQAGLRLTLSDGAAARGAPPEALPTTQPRGTDGTHERAERYYYRNTEVDVPATLVSRPPIVIPEYAYHSRLIGTVRARVFIGASGAVDTVHIVDVRPVRGLFEAAALDALRQMRYRPALLDGRPVRNQKVVEVTFDPREEI
ncbi:MAG: TonB family protein [Burkholderiales bacterium]